LSPDELQRSLIIGYTTTETAARLLEEVRICCTYHVMEANVEHRHTFVPVKNCFQF
jgi:hypothetical protein